MECIKINEMVFYLNQGIKLLLEAKILPVIAEEKYHNNSLSDIALIILANDIF